MSVEYEFFYVYPWKGWEDLLPKVSKFLNTIEKEDLITINTSATDRGKWAIVWYQTKQTKQTKQTIPNPDPAIYGYK
jgi:hypothetical protein